MAKKILLFTSDLYEGGVAESSRKLAKLLDILNFDTTICSYDNLEIKKSISKDVQLYKLNVPLSVGFRENKIDKLYTKIMRYLFLPYAFFKFLYVLYRTKPDIVFSLTYIPNIINVLASYLFNFKCIVSERQDPREDLKNSKGFSVILKFFYRKADLVHANSFEMIQSIKEFYELADNKIIHFDNFFFKDEIYALSKEFVDENLFSAKYNIITAGRLSKQKGQWHLIHVIKCMREQGVDVECYILGSGELLDYLMNLSIELGVQEYVHFIGNVDNPFKYISKCDLFVFPSIWESFGNSLAETMALGVPVASTSCHSGPGYIIGYGKYGYNLGVLPDFGTSMPNEKYEYLSLELSKLLESNKSFYKEKSTDGFTRFDSLHVSNIISRIFN